MAHAHSIYDTDRHFKIDPLTRLITYQSDAKLSIAQFDHNSERFTFELPRYIEEHDMSTCNKVRVHYINTGTGGRYSDAQELTDLQLSPEDENVVICSWLVSQNSTRIAGSLNFVLEFLCMTEDIIDYAWHTTVCAGIKISDGINNAESIVEQNSDILEQWLHGLVDAGIMSVKDIEAARDLAIIDVNSAKDTAVSAVNSSKNAALNAVETAKNNAVDAVVSESVIELDAQVRRVKGTITLYASGWNSNEQTVTIEGASEYSGVFFAPVARADQVAASKAGLFSTANGNVITMSVRKTPTADINLSYFIIGVEYSS